MSHYKPYPAYKDSGVEWIGEVPEGWDVARIKRVSSLRTERWVFWTNVIGHSGYRDRLF
ncbi:hypothetical protein [Ferrovum myxofaciens]|uniref:Restriction endonuclease subunit S n=1 Tax=Ferrovum myxofaciens TaxID=416213 RepID=A0A9E6MVE8_9PROT|nr:hypothetical protein [Ferrovum myxofaciens]QSH81868.1 MAG: hypothetical protein HO273_10685 [Ferrovum myxofaciens]QWY74365.1 MAG: hypothetical protein JVY19_11230 [Ferrovum myxofaciens]QWY77116.1 MAG: hypothetical protein JZL65_11675 [Ferrovum myxofaciens]